MRVRELPSDCDHLLVRPWVDPVIDEVGHDPRSSYVERFWLGVLGPSTTWLLRHLADRLETTPEGFDLALDECAAALGLGRQQGPNGAFPRTIVRCCQFGAGRLVPGQPATLEVRRKLPPLTQRQVARLSPALRAAHAEWIDRAPTSTISPELRLRARRLALTLVELGENREATERQLQRWRFHPAVAADVTEWAFREHAARQARRHEPAERQAPDEATAMRHASRPEAAGCDAARQPTASQQHPAEREAAEQTASRRHPAEREAAEQLTGPPTAAAAPAPREHAAAALVAARPHQAADREQCLTP